MDMVAVTYNGLTVHNMGVIRRSLDKGIRFTILILNPESQFTQIHENMYHAAGNIKEQIKNSIELLYKEKSSNSESHENLIIRKYECLAPHSLTIIDRQDDDKAWIRVEDRPLGSIPEDRPSFTVYKKNDSDFF